MSDNPIMVDDREGSKRLVTYPALSSIATLCRLDYADVAFVGNGPSDEPVLVGVEVKSIHDLISSMSTGRLQATQLPGLLATYPVRWLLYYGGYRPGRDGRLETARGRRWTPHRIGSRHVPYGYVESFLFDLVAVGVSVRHVEDEGTAVAWIACLHRWWSKEWSRHKGLHKFDNSREVSLMPGMTDDVHFRASVASKFPGLGFERAVAAARHFDSVSTMVNATAEDWQRVPGVGKVIAKAIVAAVR